MDQIAWQRDLDIFLVAVNDPDGNLSIPFDKLGVVGRELAGIFRFFVALLDQARFKALRGLGPVHLVAAKRLGNVAPLRRV